MKYFILGEDGNIGKSFKNKILIKNETIVKTEEESDVIALCVNSELSKQYIKKYDDKILLNFSSYKVEKKNVINGIGCSTLSVLKPLEMIKELYSDIKDVNVTVLFPQTSLSNKSKHKSQNVNIPIHILNHKHQSELEEITGLKINMVHIITPAEKYITSSIMIKFKKEVDLKKYIKNYELTTRDNKTWNIISVLDNIEEVVEYTLKQLRYKLF